MHAPPAGRAESRPSVPDPAPASNRVALWAATVAAAAAYAWAYARHPSRPDTPSPGQGWWAGYDQIHYLRAATAWASGDLDPAHHWYLPGYPLLGAPFVRLTPADPFAVPDVVCLLASLWLTAALAARLAPGWPRAPVLGAAAFLGVVLLSPTALDAWVVPWSTSLAAPLTLGCLAAAATVSRRWEDARADDARPAGRDEAGPAAPAFAAGLCGAAVALARPADAAVLLAAVGLVLLAQAARTRPGRRPVAAAVLAGSAGVACGAALVLAPYVAVHGWARSGYLAGSARYGFEWRLIPLRWVLVVLSPRPLFPDGRGLAEVFVWVLPGLAGMAACLAAPPSVSPKGGGPAVARRRAPDRADGTRTSRPPRDESPRDGGGARWAHGLIVLAAAGQLLLYLAYRDLHPQGLWRYGNHHYLKWLLPLLALYALLLVAVVARRRRAGLVAGAATLALVPWRAELVPLGPMPERVEAGGDLVLPPLRLGVRDAVLVGAEGTFAAMYHGAHTLRVGERAYEAGADFKLFPQWGGAMLMPLRPLGVGPVRLGPARDDAAGGVAGARPGMTLRPGVAPVLARVRVVPGLPCWGGTFAPGCRSVEPLPPPPWPADGVLRFDGTELPFLGDGWSGAEAGGRWTEGERAELRLPVSGSALVAIHGHAFVPPGAAPLGLRLLADGETVGAWRIGAGEQPAIEAGLSREGGAGPVTLALEFDAPRRPSDTLPGSRDKRRLGLFVRSVTVAPRP